MCVQKALAEKLVPQLPFPLISSFRQGLCQSVLSYIVLRGHLISELVHSAQISRHQEYLMQTLGVSGC